MMCATDSLAAGSPNPPGAAHLRAPSMENMHAHSGMFAGGMDGCERTYQLRNGAENLSAGDHVCCIYDTMSEHREVTMEFVRVGLQANQKVIYLHHQATHKEVCEWFESEGIDMGGLIAKGQLVVGPAEGFYLAKGFFDVNHVLSSLRTENDSAYAEGYTGLCVTADMSWSVASGTAGYGKWRDKMHLCHYEAEVNRLSQSFERKFIGLCQYQSSLFHPSCLNKVLVVHPLAYVAGEVYDNFYYQAPEDFLGNNKYVLLQKRISNLRDRRLLELRLRQVGEEALRLRDEAEAANRAKSNFLAQMSHEIRTPMSGIITTGDMLAATDLNPAQRELVSAISGSSRYLLSILNDVLLYSRMEACMVQLEERPIDVHGLVHEAQRLFQNPANEKHIDLSVSVAPTVPQTLMADSTRLLQIIVNLISNAVKFTPAGGCVTVTCQPHQDQQSEADTCRLLFTVSDTGIGIPEDKQGSIYDSFMQVDISTTRRYGGSGLGLAICNRLTRLMNGTIRVDPARTKLGEGTTMELDVTFKVVKDTKEPGFPTTTRPDEFSHLLMDSDSIFSLSRSTSLSEPSDSGVSVSDPPFSDAYSPSQTPEITRKFTFSPDGTPTTTWRRRNSNPPKSDHPCNPSSSTQPSAALRRSASTTCIRTEYSDADKNTQNGGILSAGEKNEKCGVLTSTSNTPSRNRRRTSGVTGERERTIKRKVSGQNSPEGGLKKFGNEFQEICVLVVEDNQLNQQVTRKLLTGLGVGWVEIAENGAVAVEMCEGGSYDLVLMDIQMPVMDGYEATRILKAKYGTQGPRIVALSAGFHDPEDHAAEQQAFDDWLTKPITLANMVQALRTHAGKNPGTSESDCSGM